MAYALHQAVLQTPVGTIVIEGDARMLTAVRILTDGDNPPDPDALGNGAVALAAQQLTEYFTGTRQSFTVPLAPLSSQRGMALRQGMGDIPYGHSLTYGALAALLNSAPRAIGQACRRNPFPIIVPCHRVRSSTGPEFYSGGNGAETKAWLTDFEQRMFTEAQKFRLW